MFQSQISIAGSQPSFKKHYMWPGRWVKFSANIGDAFHARDGRVVGIYVGAKDGEPAYIAVVDKDGYNLMIDVAGTVVQVKVNPDQPMLEPVTDRADIPPKRLVNAPPDWQPRRD